jgi:hypothetical protein
MSGKRTMASRKRAALNPELLAARAAKRAAVAAQSVLGRDEPARRAAKKRKLPGKAKARSKRKPSSKPAAKPAANSNIVPVADIAAQTAFARKGAASAAAFRPWYWRY